LQSSQAQLEQISQQHNSERAHLNAKVTELEQKL